MDRVPGLTVAFPTCNGARHLREAIAGLCGQSGVAFHLVVSDDRSDDETLAIVGRELGDRAIISVNSERLGLARNWNRCVALSPTDRVAIFHQDDVMRPGHLAAHLAAFASQPGLGLVGSASGVIDAEGSEIPATIVGRGGCGAVDRTFAPGEFVRELAVENPLRCSAVTLDAEAHEQVGGFDPAFRYVVDWDFWLRIARIRPVAWLARPTVDVRWHSSSETHRFKTGTADLDETADLLDSLDRIDGPRWADAASLRRKADQRLSRAFLNRAYEASRGTDRRLARKCLARSIQLRPAILARIALDPRLMARLLTAFLPDSTRDDG